MEQVRFIKDEEEGKEFLIPGDSVFFNNICYSDGSPVIITRGHPIVIKVGKRKFLKVILD